MKLKDLFGTQKGGRIAFHADKRKHKNPVPSKTTKLNSFIDVFGGMAGYSAKDSVHADKGYPK